jgi:tetratricopeptide (TPR) repeat protein
MLSGFTAVSGQSDFNKRQGLYMKRLFVALLILAGLILLTAVQGFPKKEPTLQELQQMAQKNPNAPQVHYMLGLKYEIDGNPRKALQSYQRATSLKPNYPEALYRIGELKWQQGDQDAAIKALQKALKLKPDYQEAKLGLAAMFGQQGSGLLEQGQWSAAAKVLQKAVDNNPEDDAAFNNLGVAYGQMGSWDLAAKAFQAAIATNFGNISAQYNLGFTFLQTGNKPASLTQYAILVGLDPDSAGELFGLISFPKGRDDTPYETPQFGQTRMRTSLPSEVAAAAPPLPTPDYPGDLPDSRVEDTYGMQKPEFKSKLPAGQLQESPGTGGYGGSYPTERLP